MSTALPTHNFKKLNGRVYWGSKVIKGADYDSFEPLNHIWARDKKHIYSYKSPLRRVDHETFTVLNPLFAKDKAAVYFLSGRIPEANPATFRALDTGWFSNAFGMVSQQGYGADDKNVFHHVLTIGKPRLIKGADVPTFRVLDYGFAADKARVYSEGVRLPKANPASFRVLGHYYSTDGARVYYGSSIVEGADPETFCVCPEDSLRGYDKNNKYERFQNITEHQGGPVADLSATDTSREGKNDRFARLVTVSLAPYVGNDYRTILAPHYGFRRETSFGHEKVEVMLWGAHAPHRHLQFPLGVWHEQYEEVRLQLQLHPTTFGASHFWQTTSNLRGSWPIQSKQDGRWDANLNEDPSSLAPEIAAYLSEAMGLFFGSCSDLRAIRQILLSGYNGGLFTHDPWREIVLIDAALRDWEHLREFVARTDLPFSKNRDMSMIKKIKDTFGFEYSNLE